MAEDELQSQGKALAAPCSSDPEYSSAIVFSSTYYIDYYLGNVPFLAAVSSVTVAQTVAAIYWSVTLLLLHPKDSASVGPQHLAQLDFQVIRSVSSSFSCYGAHQH